VTAAVLALFVCAGIAYAADDSAKTSSDVGRKTVDTVTDTAKSAVDGTTDTIKASVSDTVAAPETAIQAVKDTANTALNRTDAVMKSITGEKTE